MFAQTQSRQADTQTNSRLYKHMVIIGMNEMEWNSCDMMGASPSLCTLYAQMTYH